ncbi:MAG: antitoxin family protein [Thermoproteus sp.]
MVVVRARYEGGVLKPLEPLDLKEGEEVMVVVRRLDVKRFFGIVKGVEPDEEDYYEYLAERSGLSGH